MGTTDHGPVWDIFSPIVERLRTSGRNYAIGVCPFHDDKHPSFSISLTTGDWRCFSASCGLRGTLVTFLKLMGKSYEEIDATVKYIGIDLSKAKAKHIFNQENRFAKDRFIGDFILNEAILGTFDYTPKALKEAGFKDFTLKSFEVGFDRNLGRITYPIRDLYGNLVGIAGRTVRGEEPRYLFYTGREFGEEFTEMYPNYSLDKRKYLWNGHNVIPNILKSEDDRPLYIVEGYKACMWLVQNGFPNTIAQMGAYLSQEQHDLIARTDNDVVLFLDCGPAGQNATKKIGQRLHKTNRNLYVGIYPEDADDSFQPDSLNKTELNIALTIERVRWRTWISTNS